MLPNLTLPLNEGVILSHTKLDSQLDKLSRWQRLGQDINYLLARGYVLYFTVFFRIKVKPLQEQFSGRMAKT